jgi:DNA polymerase-1
LSDKVRLLLQVHDELIYEIEENVFDSVKKDIETKMEQVFQDSFLKLSLDVPLEVDVQSGNSWFDLK